MSYEGQQIGPEIRSTDFWSFRVKSDDPEADMNRLLEALQQIEQGYDYETGSRAASLRRALRFGLVAPERKKVAMVCGRPIHQILREGRLTVAVTQERVSRTVLARRFSIFKTWLSPEHQSHSSIGERDFQILKAAWKLAGLPEPETREQHFGPSEVVA